MALKIPPLLLMLLFMLLAWLLAPLLPDAVWVLPLQRQFSLLLALIGVTVCGAGVIRFRLLGTTMNPVNLAATSKLVTDGIYRFSRNPMYLGFLLLLVAWSLYLQPFLVLLAPPAFVLYMNRFQIRIEEQALVARFGDVYVDYRQRVRRWL